MHEHHALQVEAALDVQTECSPACASSQTCHLGACQCAFGVLSTGVCIASNGTLCNQCNLQNFGTCILDAATLSSRTCVCHDGWIGAR